MSPFMVASISSVESSSPSCSRLGPCPWPRCGTSCTSSTGLHAIGHRPEQRVGVVGIDVLVDRDADLAAVALEERRAVSARQTSVRGVPFSSTMTRDAQQSGQRLVQRDALHAADAERVAQMRQEQRLVGDALDHARFARRHLADVGRDDRRCGDA